MARFVPPHLPVVSELDNTRNWETLSAFIENELEGGGATGFTNTQIAIAYRSAVQELPGAAWTKIELDKTIHDPNGLIKSGSYKVAVDGIYQVSGQIAVLEAELKNVVSSAIYVNTVEKIRGAYLSPATESFTGAAPAAGLLKCKAGDEIELWGFKSGKKTALQIAEFNNRLSVFRVPPEVAEVEGAAGGDLTGTYPNPTIVSSVFAGVWTNPESFSSKTEEHTTLQVRKEQGATSVRLKGFLKAKEELPAKTIVCTLPTGFRPTETVSLPAINRNTGVVNPAHVLTTGEVEIRLALPITQFWSLDSCTFNLT